MTDEQLIKELSTGLTVKEIADNFSINNRTLEARLVRLKDKNSCKNNTALVAFFLRNNLIK